MRYHLVLLFILFSVNRTVHAQLVPRHLERIAFDSNRNTLIMYGGAAMVDGVLTYFPNVYEWDQSEWREIKAEGPGGRNASPLVYDPVSKLTFLFGGVTEDKEGYTIHFDVWSWDGKKWKLMSTDCPVKEPDAVYDPAAERILVYGEVSNKSTIQYSGERSFELWEYKSNQWKKLSADGPDIYPVLSFDVSRNTLIVPFLEDGRGEIWEWSDNHWRKIPCETQCPESRTRQAMTYDPVTKATYMFGGRNNSRNYLNDFWKWDGKSWTKTECTNPPPVRASARLISSKDGLLMYGGAVNGGLSNEIWEWKGNAWTLIK